MPVHFGMGGQRASDSPLAGGSGSAIRAGVLLPPRDVLPAVAAATTAVLRAWTAERNAAGRGPIELVFAAPEGSPEERTRTARSFVEKEQPLALVASFTDGADAELAVLANEIGIPLLATLSSSPHSSLSPAEWLRDLCGGAVEQGLALVRAVGARKVAIVNCAGAPGEALARRVEAAGVGALPVAVDKASAAELRDAGADALLLIGGDPALVRLLDEMRALDWWPPLLVPGGALPPQTFDRARLAGGLWIALPTIDRDRQQEAIDAYLQLARRHAIPAAHQLSQFAALTSLQLFADALERVGGQPDRRSLLAEIDRTQMFRGGLFPPLSYRPDRHVGSTGAWVIPVHRGRDADPQWVDSG